MDYISIDKKEGVMATKTDPVAEGQLPMFPDDEPAFEGEVVEENETLVSMIPPSHHVVVGMGTLAAMSEEDFTAKLAIMRTGQDRIRVIMDQLLVNGEDYGKVKGIERPFLHQPGAEKLSNFYGFAVRQEAERIIGQRAVVKIGATEEPGEWLSPPLAYHVRSYVHLGSFDGPVVAMGYGEASSWEEKYRYRWAKATCPKCGREGLIKGKADGKLKGKWWCPQREGGCNSTFEAADPQIAPPAKVDNPDPHSLAETLIQMAGKRSFVASIRRATGTSGLFTQDEDSPNVQQQVAGINQEDPEPAVSTAPAMNVGVGAKTAAPAAEQLKRLVSLSKEKDIGLPGMASLFDRLFKIEVEETSRAVSAAARALTAEQLGKMLWAMETGEVPDPIEESRASGIVLEADGMPV